MPVDAMHALSLISSLRKVFGLTARNNNESETNLQKNHPLGDVEHLKRDLAGKSISGGVSMAISEIGCNVFRLAGTVVLARLLTPEHFGLISMVTALTAFAEMFKDLGLGIATIQRREITHEQISTLFWINTGVGILIMLLMAGASPLISRFYGDTRLLWVSIAISSTFFFGGLTIQHQALLLRHMHFARLAFIQVFSTALSFAIGIFLDWKGFEYWALVWKEVSQAVFNAIGMWLLCRWFPGLPRRGSGIGMMLRTGQHVTGFNIVVFASRNLDQVLLGKFWGPGPVGLYRQAVQLLMLPVSLFSFPLTYVMTPALSALQGEPERYRKYYKTVVSFLSFGYMPLVAYLAVYSDSFITLVLGEQWMASSSVLRILALATFVEAITSTCGSVMITSGRTKAYLGLGVIQAAFLGFAYCIGVNWGIIGVATAYVAYTYLTLLPFLWFSYKNTPISVRLFFEAISLPALSSMIMSLLLIMIRYNFRPPDALSEIAFSLLLAPLLYCGVLVLLPRGKQKLIEYFSCLRLTFEALTFWVCSPASPRVSSH